MIRDDIGSGPLLRSLIAMIVSAVTADPRPRKQEMTAGITGLFLDGARAQPRAEHR